MRLLQGKDKLDLSLSLCLSHFFFNRRATSSAADKSRENKITSSAELAEKLRGPNLTINQLFDRNHQSILVGELIQEGEGWRGRERYRDTVTERKREGERGGE